VNTTLLIISIFSFGVAIMNGAAIRYKTKFDKFALIFFSFQSLCLFVFIIYFITRGYPPLFDKLLMLIVPTSIWLFTFFSIQKEKSILFNFFETGEKLIDNLFNKLGYLIGILIIIGLVLLTLFLIIKLIKFIWFY
jgi:hypothetical protein